MKYKEFQPTTADVRGLGLIDQQDWLVVPVMRTRDSDLLAECNLEAALEILGGESETVEVHRFKHWGPGWYEIILVHPDHRTEVEDIEEALAGDPCLDTSRLRQLRQEAWESMDIRDRMWVCVKNGMSRFRARSDAVPTLPYAAL